MIKELLVIGDSWTFGSEIRPDDLPESTRDWDKKNDEYRIERIWPTKLAKKMGLDDVINLSYPGTSNDWCIRKLVSWLFTEYISKKKSTKDLFVIFGLTSPERRDFFYEDEKQSGYWATTWPMWKHDYVHDKLNQFVDLYSENFNNDVDNTHRYISQLFYLQNFFKVYGINFLFFQSFYQNNKSIYEWKDKPYVEYTKMQWESNLIGQPDNLIWNEIDHVRFMNKHKRIHSFHNYVVNIDKNLGTNDAFLLMHPSESAHTWWADYVFEYCTEHRLFEGLETKKKLI